MSTIIIIYSFVFTIGLIFGSFCNVLIHRTPIGEDVVKGRSKCPKCNKKLYFWHNIPLLSFIFLRGKCYFCKDKISFIYPLIETMCGLVFMAVFARINLDGSNFMSFSFIIVAVIFCLLLSLCIIDLRIKAVPESLLAISLALTFVYIIASSEIYFMMDKFLDIFIVLGIFYLIRFYVSYFIKKEAMGEGDIIIGAIMGGLLGIKLSLFAIFFASIIALPFSYYSKLKGEAELAFIPFLSFATFLIFLFDSYFLEFIDYVIS